MFLTSAFPLAWGWYGHVYDALILSRCSTALIVPFRNSVPLSVFNTSGMPYRRNTFDVCSLDMVSASLWACAERDSHPVSESTTTEIIVFPPTVSGISVIRSACTFGRASLGSGCAGVSGSPLLLCPPSSCGSAYISGNGRRQFSSCHSSNTWSLHLQVFS